MSNKLYLLERLRTQDHFQQTQTNSSEFGPQKTNLFIILLHQKSPLQKRYNFCIFLSSYRLFLHDKPHPNDTASLNNHRYLALFCICTYLNLIRSYEVAVGQLHHLDYQNRHHYVDQFQLLNYASSIGLRLPNIVCVVRNFYDDIFLVSIQFFITRILPISWQLEMSLFSLILEILQWISNGRHKRGFDQKYYKINLFSQKKKDFKPRKPSYLYLLYLKKAKMARDSSS